MKFSNFTGVCKQCFQTCTSQYIHVVITKKPAASLMMERDKER